MVKKRNLVTEGILLMFGFQGLLVWVVFCLFCVFAKQAAEILAAVGAVLLGRILRRCIGLFAVPNSLFQ